MRNCSILFTSFVVFALAACRAGGMITSEPSGALVTREVYEPGLGEQNERVVRPISLGLTPAKINHTWRDVRQGQQLRLKITLQGYVTKYHELPLGDFDTDIHIDLEKAPYREITIPVLEYDAAGNLKYTLKKSIAYQEVIEREGVTPTMIVEGGDTSFFSSMCFSPDGEKLLFASHEIGVEARTGKTSTNAVNLFLVPKEGGGLQQVTQTRHINIDPAFTPDGKSIILASNRSGSHTDLIKIPVTGAVMVTVLTQSEANDRQPSVGPDNLVAFTSYPKGVAKPQIWTIGGSEGFPTQLREGHSPILSPDGKMIAFIGIDGELWTMTVRGERQTQLTTTTGTLKADPSWSPDGQWVVFVSNASKDGLGNLNNDIWAMNTTTMQSTQLTTNGSDDRAPIFSRDGKYVYFTSNRGFKWSIWRIPFQVR